MNLTPEQAASILNTAMRINAFPEGAMPESDKDKVDEATKIVELAQQQMVVVKQIGEQNVPPANLAALKEVLQTAGIDPDGDGSATEAAAAHVATADVPAEQPAAAPVQEPAAQPEADPVPPVADPAVDGKQKGEVWVDENNNEWEIVTGGGGPQVEAKQLTTGETTVLPSGFLKRRVREAQAEGAEPSADTPPALEPGEQREYTNGSTYELVEVQGENVLVKDPGTENHYAIPTADWLKCPGIEAQPTSPLAPEPDPTPEPEQQIQVVEGENRTSPADGNTYVLKGVEVDQVVVTDIRGNNPSPLALAVWVTWPVVEGVTGITPPVQPDAHTDPQVPAEPEPSTPAATEPPKHADQELTVAVDDDEGSEEYGNVLAQVTADYTPKSMPAPMDLDREPTPMPDDLTNVDDITARRLHSQFNALASRARYLHGLEEAKARAIGRLVKLKMRGPVIAARAELGKDASVAEVMLEAEQHEDVVDWIRRRDKHSDRADAYKTFLSFYTEDVSVLSRDWTMREQEKAGS